MIRHQIVEIDASVTSEPSAEALARKERSIALLKQANIPLLQGLPVIEDSQTARKRTKAEVAHRAIALCLVAVKGEGLEHSIVQNLVAHYGAQTFFTPEETAFIANPVPSEHDRIQFCWQYEGYWVMLWSLGYIQSLGQPDAMCDVPRAVNILRDLTTDEFITQASLRDVLQILDEADLIYRQNWAAVDARTSGRDDPAGINGEITVERHHALNWLIGYMNQEWDDVRTDT